VAEGARNLACVGAVPTAVTNNLNFGNPLKPANYFQLREAVVGMAEACAFFETPVTGGNVSLYNETGGKAVYPTPVIGMVGILDDVSKAVGLGFRAEGDVIVLLGTNREEIGASEYLYQKRGIVAGRPPAVDLEGERQLQRALLRLAEMGLLRSAHDCSEGGLACALAEAACAGPEGPWGVEAEVNEDLSPVALLFGESHGRVVASCEKARVSDVLGIAGSHEVPARVLGTVRARGGTFSVVTPLGFIRTRSDEVARRYRDTIPTLMEAR
jgi:phosphoribosylformylglycinamidine synthase